MSKREIRNYLLLSISLLLFSLIFLLYFVRGAEAKIYGAICGQVIAEDTGKGIKDAYLALYRVERMESERLIGLIATDSNGNFCFEMLEPGMYMVFCGFDPRTGYYCDETWRFPLVRHNPIITLERGKNVIGLKKVAKIGGTAIIKILKRDGSRFVIPKDRDLELIGFRKNKESFNIPTPNHEFIIPGHFFMPPRKNVIFPIQMDESGNIIRKGLPPDIYKFQASIYGHASRTIENVTIEKGKTTEVIFTIDFDDPTGIEGKVTSSIDGGPITEVLITVDRIVNNVEIEEGQYITDESGYFSMVGLSPGPIAVSYRHLDQEESNKTKTFIIQGKKIWLDLKLNIPSNVKKIQK